MAGPDRPNPTSVVDAIKNVFDMTPQGEGGIGPTLGQDVGPQAQRRTDAQSDAKPAASTEDDDDDGVVGSFNPNRGE